MTAEDRLSAFLNEGRAPARDLAFEAEVMQRVAGRELMRTVAGAGVLAAAGGVVLWAVAPIISTAIEPASATLATPAAILAVTAGMLLFGQRLLRPS
ncbi:MAG: hypothetical protein KA105_09525 [Caulobacter sp.]|nr:hypothetical protein [Caulobacter sp.]